MKILLVRPRASKYTIGLKNIMICEPLELEYLAAAIPPEHTVQILDMILENKLEETIRTFKPDVVGTSSYITGVNQVKAVCRKAKSVYPELVTVVGGVHASLNPGDYEEDAVDYIIRGEGTKEFNRLIESISRKEKYCMQPVMDATELLVVDAEHLPLPRRDLTQKYHHRYYYLFHQPVTIVKTAFGCPFSCNFCYCRALTNGKVYLRTPQSVIDELQSIPNKEIYIIDDTFFVNRQRVMELHRLIQSHNIRKEYLIYGHADFIVNNPDVVEAWAGIGLKACIVGLESPIDEELKGFKKSATVDKNKQAIKILQQYRVDVYASFIADPAWTVQDFRKLGRFIKENRLFYIVIQPNTPIPGTEIYSEDADFIVPRHYYELWDMQHTVVKPLLGEKKFYREIRKLYVQTVFNPFRFPKLKLHTAPPVFSLKYLRLMKGALRIYADLRNAHKHRRLIDKDSHQL